MNTVEKAFLKSSQKKGEKNDDIDLSLPKEDSIRRDAGKLTSSRKSISNMGLLDKYSETELKDRKIIYANMPDKKTLNNYRNLRTRLLSLTKKENFVTMVSPVVTNTDASYVSANLAATFSLDEAKTSMLIEANINEPILNSIFDKKEQKGLVDYLSSEELSSETALQKTRVPRLGYVPSGSLRENSAEYFTSTKMEAFIGEMVGRYPDRFPIINAPSVLDSADARILLRLCDLVILVVPYGKCSKDDILRASVLVGNEKLAGLVLSDF
ncbi:MAG: CpsD/CapB family tyrosine-protein kinase [Kangiellaceae bacterium]|nr:CpsD/CapB family tyrosine-protein kinase [Kangiellaceae bacterium]MCW9000725.1 CpsD/CapB family tyrosine-protein kinase [Kangiellaceae bacterium]